MLIHDRVFCDLCEGMVGQLFSRPAQSPDLIEDQRLSPHFVVCPDCYDSAEPVEKEAA